MPTTRCRRQSHRYAVPDGTAGRVCFDYPTRGPSHDLRLVDVSLSSISFAYEDGSMELEAGVDISSVVIQLGSSEMRGDLVVMHVTPTPFGARCGAMFYPASDEDLMTLRRTVAELEGEPSA